MASSKVEDWRSVEVERQVWWKCGPASGCQRACKIRHSQTSSQHLTTSVQILGIRHINIIILMIHANLAAVHPMRSIRQKEGYLRNAMNLAGILSFETPDLLVSNVKHQLTCNTTSWFGYNHQISPVIHPTLAYTCRVHPRDIRCVRGPPTTAEITARPAHSIPNAASSSLGLTSVNAISSSSPRSTRPAGVVAPLVAVVVSPRHPQTLQGKANHRDRGVLATRDTAEGG